MASFRGEELLRAEAAKVLTDEQRQQLEPLAKMPSTMLEMHRQMREKMPQAPGCPLMEMMHPTNSGVPEDHGHQTQ